MLCNLKYNPQALHTGSPLLLRRQRLVLVVVQFEQRRPARRAFGCFKNKTKQK